MSVDRYDRVAYRGGAHATSHPDRLAVQASLFGIDVAPVETARILELGCGDGSNILPMSVDLPDATIVGVDLAAEPIERALRASRGLGLPNIEFVQGDVRDLPESIGAEFDYVIAHGVYSWIPQDARDALMAACARLLAPNGIAFISYNAYPGSHVRDTIREIVAYAVGDTDDPDVRIESSRRVLELLAGSGNPDPHARALATYAAQLLERPPWLLYHDELAPICDAFYLHEFIAHARSHDLQYLFESRLAHGVVQGLSPRAAEALATLPDAVEVREQFLDFVVNRLFRESLLCRVPIGESRTIDPNRLGSLRIAARVGERTGAVRQVGDGTVNVENEELATAIEHIGAAWPASVSFSDVAPDPHGDVTATVLDLHVHGLVELEAREVDAVTTSDRPRVSAWNRWQAKDGRETATNARHEEIGIEGELSRELMRLLDGSRDVAAIATELDAEPDQVRMAIDRLGELALLRR